MATKTASKAAAGIQPKALTVGLVKVTCIHSLTIRARLEQVQALGFDDRFIRKWSYYLSYCEAAFALRNISVVHTLHTRANNLAF